MNTNGGAKDPEWWGELASVIGRNGTVIFSVDGLSDTNHIYRQGVNWHNVERNMRAFISAGGRARWDFIIFQHNEHQVSEAEELANQWGVERFQKKKSGRFIVATADQLKPNHQAFNRKGDKTSIISEPINFINKNLALLKTAEIEKSYGSMNNYYDNCDIKCKVAKEGNIFITAEGLLMPCCWTASRMYKWWHSDYRVEQIWDFIDQAGGKAGINVLEHGIQQVMSGSLLKNIENSWSITGVKNGRLGVCSMKCGAEFDPFGEQFK
jgi:hypothetical protein